VQYVIADANSLLQIICVKYKTLISVHCALNAYALEVNSQLFLGGVKKEKILIFE
jgi:hypothetical protein